MIRLLLITAIISSSALFTSCSSILKGADVNTTYPIDNEDRRRAKRGSLTGEGGISLLGGGSNKASNNGSGIGVNAILWRATLDTLSFLPLTSVDPHGGVIITDWYEDADARGERIKLNVLIMGTELKTDALKISVFKQENEAGDWRDVKVVPSVARELEDKIFTRARELKIKESRN